MKFLLVRLIQPNETFLSSTLQLLFYDATLQESVVWCVQLPS